MVLGASLGGSVALDFAAAHPECVESLILMDAGGESYAQPDPWLTSLCADPVTNLFQWRATNGLLPYPHIWAKEKGWRQALRAYLKSGGYQVGLYQIFFHFKACVHESISFLCPPPPALSAPLQYYCTTIAQYTTLIATPLVYAIHHTI